MADTDFSKFVPGFDFLQGLMKNAGAALPGFNQWVAPTLDPQELDKRIDELRTVQFWLENNARMLTATIQALEVQRMTLSTLHAMNVPMADLKDVLKTPPAPPARPAPADAPAPASAPASASAQAESKSAPGPESGADDPAGSRPAGADPMQWWNALTQQFTQVAANAMKTAQSAATATSSATAAAASAAAAAASPKTARKSAPTPAATAAAKPAAKKAPPARKAAPKAAPKRKAP
ncbi:PhaM family polyhydroxyalkanoate granule multifunctional regulatory protein [Mitsuaria sp. 7]|uniref:PhaM family polyhydroxyalkanoate granule multifunctional regulatory protein n=1 Tax=Mitsuaria sp. 7 TaxID=1658665 RepID=UPI0007DE27B8|nr:PhaM family polyhydroxyalkanoate granule multifunctional regulatory protein [Mitsuaria sp. 7]ANH69484.1 hypothetical protein ABE85_21320 [Mitsuaria sp. 7]